MTRKQTRYPVAVRVVSYRSRSAVVSSHVLPIAVPVSLPSTRPGLLRKTFLYKNKKSEPALSASVPFPYPRISDTCLEAILPVPPSINHQYATVNGRRVLTAAGRTYKADVAQLIAIGLARSPQRASFLGKVQSAPLSLTILFCFSSAMRRDVDSGLKIAQDALCAGLRLNDNRITEIHLYKRQDRDHPRIEVTLSVLAQPLSV